MFKHYLYTLENTIKNCWDRDGLCNYGEKAYSYGYIATQFAKFHLLFEKINLQKGDRLALCAKNSATWALSFFSAITDEKVIVPILSDFHPDSVKHLVNHSDSKVLFIDNDIWNKMAKEEEFTELLIAIDASSFSLLYAKNEEIEKVYKNLDKSFEEKYPEGFKKEDVHYNIDNMESLSIINYTSGTTSAPKGVMLPYRCISATVDFAQRLIPTKPGNRIVSILPLAHIYGLVFELIYPFCHGTTIYFLNKKPSPSLLLAAMGSVKPYLVFAVPLVMEKIYQGKLKPILQKPAVKFMMKIPGLRHILFKKMRDGLMNAFGGEVQMFILGGAALNPEVEGILRKIGLPYTVGYGMTEAAPLIAYEHWTKFAQGSCGKAIDTLTVRIDSDDPHNIVGEIQAKGYNVCSGYYKNPEATQALFTEDGYLKTGDLGIIDAQGNIFIKGRCKSMLLSANGQNVYPEEIEAVLNCKEYVLESIVVEREGKFVALLYLDYDKLNKEGKTQEQVEAIANDIIKVSNKDLPVYSQISRAELVKDAFAKTPKLSIKRFMYS